MDGSPQIAVDVYPWEGGSFSLIGGQVLSATISKGLRNSGIASIILAPGGPAGQGWPSWSQVITLQSLVVIAQSRGPNAYVDFVGVVVRTSEEQSWEAGARVTRVIRVEAVDWMQWFVAFNWTALSYLGAVNGAAYEAAAGLPAGSGPPSIYFAGQNSSNPSTIAANWLKLMGDDLGVLAKTRLQYGSTSVLWPAATTSWFETYPYNAIFPASQFYVSEAGSWWSKFTTILEWPFYEIIIGTAPQGLWNGLAVSGAISASGQSFYSATMPGAVPAQAQIVGRLNPQPDLNLAGAVQSSSGISVSTAQVFSSANLDRWYALPTFTPDEGSASFISSETSNAISEYANFIMLNPVNSRVPLGLNMSGVQIFSFSGAADIAGIHRYGLIDRTWDSMWFADPGQVVMQGPPQTTQTNLETLMNSLTARLATYFMPTPLMESAGVTLPLRPDIFPGCRWTYSPFRGDEPWDFYISAVSHRYVFGGPSTTTLGLERGLPMSVYGNSSNMMQLLLGRAQRKDGGFVFGSPPNGDPGLQIFGMVDSSMREVLAQIAAVYATPGAR